MVHNTLNIYYTVMGKTQMGPLKGNSSLVPLVSTLVYAELYATNQNPSALGLDLTSLYNIWSYSYLPSAKLGNRA